MLFIDERTACLAAMLEEVPPLCAIAKELDSARTAASAIIEIFIVICFSPFWSLLND
jgi:hypothetical protein